MSKDARSDGATGGPPPRLLALIVAGAMFMAQLDGTIVATALPQMARSFGTGATNLSLGISIYLLAQTVLLPASAWVSDRFGSRRVFGGAVMLFTLASVLCGLSASLDQFVAARVLQGAAAALMTPVGRVVLIRSTAKRDLVGMLTLASTPMLVAPTLGPPVGGFIVSYLSWPWVFYLNVPFGLLCVALIARFVPDIRAAPRPFDWTGFGLTGAAMTGLIYGLDRITAPGSSRFVAASCLAGGAIAAVAAVAHAHRAAHPLLSLRPLASRPFRIVAIEGGTLARLPMRAVPFVAPLAFQVGLGMSAFASGLLLMASSGSDLLVKPLVAPLLRRTGFRAAIIRSQIGSSVAIAALGAGLALAPYPALFVLLGAIGVARSILFSSMSALLYEGMPDADIGAATVLWNVIQQASNAFAVSFTVILLNTLSCARGACAGRPSSADFTLTLVVMAALGLAALASFRRLSPTAGDALSGRAARR